MLAPQGQPAWRAPHFVWYVREELRERLCGEEETCDQLERGGLRVVDDARLGHPAVGREVDRRPRPSCRTGPTRRRRPRRWACPTRRGWQRLRGQNVWNGALSAIDYERGEIIAYVGSANYYERRKVEPARCSRSSTCSPRAGGSRARPSSPSPTPRASTSAALTAATMLMDVTTDFGGGYTPTDFNGRERGPVRVRNALQFSLNIPAVKALAMVGENDVFERSQEFGMDFQAVGPRPASRWPWAPSRSIRSTSTTSYGTIANGGRNIGPHLDPRGHRSDGNEVLPPYEPPRGERGHLRAGRRRHHRHPGRQHGPGGQPDLGRHMRHRPPTASAARRRFKTGTTNDAKDLNAYGYIAPPSAQGRKQGEYALTVGVWAGNSDASPVTTVANPVFSLDVAAPVWDAFLTRGHAHAGRCATSAGRTAWRRRSVDAFTGLPAIGVVAPAGQRALPPRHGAGGGPVPARRRGRARCDDGLVPLGGRLRGPASHARLPRPRRCRGGPIPSWNEAVRGLDPARSSRRRRGRQRVSRTKRTYTAYFYEPYFQPYGQTWGGPFAPTRSCDAAPSRAPPSHRRAHRLPSRHQAHRADRGADRAA